MERSITAGHCCETSYSPKTQTSVTVSGFILLHRRVQTAFMTIFEWMFRKMSRCANMTLDRHRGGITLYYLATQSSPEEAEDRWRYGCCSRHHDPHSSPQRLLQPRLKNTSALRSLQKQEVSICWIRTGGFQDLDFVEDEFVPQAVAPDDALPHFSELPLHSEVQQPFLERRFGATLNLVTGDLFTHFDRRNWKMIAWCLKQRTGKEGWLLCLRTKDRLLCRRRGWEGEAPLGKWWAAGFSCHLAAVWCHPGRIPPSLRRRTSQSARKQTKPLFDKNTSS